MEIVVSVRDDFPPQVNRVLLSETFLVSDLIKLELEFATIQCYELASIIDNGKGGHSLFIMLLIERSWDSELMTDEITDDFPNLADVITDCHHVLTVV